MVTVCFWHSLGGKPLLHTQKVSSATLQSLNQLGDDAGVISKNEFNQLPVALSHSTLTQVRRNQWKVVRLL